MRPSILLSTLLALSCHATVVVTATTVALGGEAFVTICDSGASLAHMASARLILQDTSPDATSDRVVTLRTGAMKVLNRVLVLEDDPSGTEILNGFSLVTTDEDTICMAFAKTTQWNQQTPAEAICANKAGADLFLGKLCTGLLGLTAEDEAASAVNRSRTMVRAACFVPNRKVVGVAECTP